MARIKIEDVKQTAMTEQETERVTGGGGGVPGVSRSGGGVPGSPAFLLGDGSVQPTSPTSSRTSLFPAISSAN